MKPSVSRVLDARPERVVALVLIPLVLSGCASKVLDKITEDDPPEVELVIEASADVNARGDESAGAPIVVRVFELKEDGAFMSASFFDLYDEEEKILGAGRRLQEWVLGPSKREQKEWTFKMDSQYLGVIAAYRDWQGGTWREVVDTPLDKRTKVSIKLERRHVKVVKKAHRGTLF